MGPDAVSVGRRVVSVGAQRAGIGPEHRAGKAGQIDRYAAGRSYRRALCPGHAAPAQADKLAQRWGDGPERTQIRAGPDDYGNLRRAQPGDRRAERIGRVDRSV